jgi:hypothetical protein
MIAFGYQQRTKPVNALVLHQKNTASISLTHQAA